MAGLGRSVRDKGSLQRVDDSAGVEGRSQPASVLPAVCQFHLTASYYLIPFPSPDPVPEPNAQTPSSSL